MIGEEEEGKGFGCYSVLALGAGGDDCSAGGREGHGRSLGEGRREGGGCCGDGFWMVVLCGLVGMVVGLWGGGA